MKETKTHNTIGANMKSSFDIVATKKQKRIVRLINETGKSYEQLKAEGYIPKSDVKGT